MSAVGNQIGQFPEFNSNIYNANIKTLTCLQGKLEFKASLLRMLSHPIFGDQFISKIEAYSCETSETDTFKLLQKINDNSDNLFKLFDAQPNIMNSPEYTLPFISGILKPVSQSQTHEFDEEQFKTAEQIYSDINFQNSSYYNLSEVEFFPDPGVEEEAEESSSKPEFHF